MYKTKIRKEIPLITKIRLDHKIDLADCKRK
jgi:hypothetical protein